MPTFLVSYSIVDDRSRQSEGTGSIVMDLSGPPADSAGVTALSDDITAFSHQRGVLPSRQSVRVMSWSEMGA